MTRAVFALFVLWGLLAAPGAQAYVTYNRLGYVSCNACHFVPTGGGLLTPYGQSVGAAMSAFAQEAMPEDRPFVAGVQARAIELNSTPQANPFLMQADVLGSARLGRGAQLDAVVGANLKQDQSGFAALPSGWDAVVLRRALLTVAVSDTGTIEAGRDAPVSGLNIDDHTSFLRSRNRRGVFDYPTQLRYLYQTEQLQLLPYAALPSFEEATGAGEYGGGARAEYLLNNANSVGLTGFFGNTSGISRLELGGFFRLSQEHWNGFAGEAVYSSLNLHANGTVFDQEDVYLRPYVAVPEWIETAFVFEFLRVSDPFAETSFQYGPELNIRLHRYVSVIGDGRSIGNSAHSEWSWYGQVFVHFQI